MRRPVNSKKEKKLLRKLILTLALAAAVPALANTTLFSKYEAVRQALLSNSLPKVQATATELSKAAVAAKNQKVATQATALAKSADIAKARLAFAPLSDEMVKVQTSASGARPAVYYCSMIKKSWLQPKGKVGSPYDPSMAMCGELKSE